MAEETGRHLNPSRIIFDFEVTTTFFSYEYPVPGIQEAYLFTGTGTEMDRKVKKKKDLSSL
jgi:hypothetical protein